MRREKETFIKNALLLFDITVLSCAFVLSFILRKHFSEFYAIDLIPSEHVIQNFDSTVLGYIAVYLFTTFMWFLLLFLTGSYQNIFNRSYIDVFLNILKSAFLLILSFSVIFFIEHWHFVSRLFFGIYILLSSTFLVLGRFLFMTLLKYSYLKNASQKKIIIVGTGKRSSNLIDNIKNHPEWGYDIVRIVDFEQFMPAPQALTEGYVLIRSEEQFRTLLHSIIIDEVVFAVPRSMLNWIESYLRLCEDEGIDTAVLVDLFNMKNSKLHQTQLSDIPLLTTEKRFNLDSQLILKRGFDVIVSAIGLIIFAPLIIAISILIKLTSPGPILFKQKRVTLHGRTFNIYKFRSMAVDAEKDLKNLLNLNEMEGPVFKIKNDPRITPIGKVLRRTSLDELPQLFNVLIGDMSFVGPRPPLPEEVEKYEPWQRRRLSIRPGITCLWHTRHRGENDFKKWMECDMEYIDNWSLVLDIKIFFKTILVIISGKGAY